MSGSVVAGASSSPRDLVAVRRIAFLGRQPWLEGVLPGVLTAGPEARAFELAGDPSAALDELENWSPEVSVVLDPAGIEAELLQRLPGVTLGMLLGAPPPEGDRLDAFDRLVSFDPRWTGAAVGGSHVWRAVPPPVADHLFSGVRSLHGSPRAIAIGRETPYRETMLLPAKHHHDLLHLVHGAGGTLLQRLLGEADVGVYVPAQAHAGFGHQVGLHLASGHLLLSTPLAPAHGLELDIDYVHFNSPEGLVWTLERMRRFPEMYQRVRIRGRLKAEQYRASRVFGRLFADLLADIAAFGRGPLPAPRAARA